MERVAWSVSVVRLAGEHDLAGAEALGVALAEVADGEALIVDLTTCTFIDSSIIATLLRARRARPSFAVVVPDDEANPVVRALAVTGVAPFLNCVTSLEEARSATAEVVCHGAPAAGTANGAAT
jgi:anti-anti-sigma factor